MFWNAAIIFLIPLFTAIVTYIFVASVPVSIDMLLSIFTLAVLVALAVAGTSGIIPAKTASGKRREF